MRLLSFGCIHHPIADPKAIRFLHDQIEEFKPDVLVNLGDWYDGEGWSRWDNENDWSVCDEYRAARDHARVLNSFSFIKEFIWLYGNHESNLQEPGRVKRSNRQMLHWRDWSPESGGLRDEVRHWRIREAYGARERFSIGPITFVHGTKASVYSARDEARMHGSHMGLTVSAHSHRPVDVTRDVQAGSIPADLWFANVGTGIDVDRARYTNRLNVQAWGMAVCKIEIHTKDKTMLREGRKIYPTKRWDAEVVQLGIIRDRL